MAKLCCLYSSSSGNCTYIEDKGTAILVDVGVSAKKIKTALIERNIDFSTIQAIFLTHEHKDHVCGLKVLCKTLKIPVYLTNGTYEGLLNNGITETDADFRILTPDIFIGSLTVNYFRTSHDSLESCGYIIQASEKKIAVCTDLGFVSEEVHSHLEGCDVVMLESNHDPKILQNNLMYPYPLKRRILSQSGHLSNSACAAEILKLINTGSTRFVLGHLSEANNTPLLAKETTKSVLTINGFFEDEDYFLTVAYAQDNDVIIF